MIITCLVMLVLSLKQSAQMRGLQQEISAKEKWIEKNFSNANHEFFQDLQSRADMELKNQAEKPDFFLSLFPTNPIGAVCFRTLPG